MHILNEFFENVFVISRKDSTRYTTFKANWDGLEFRLAKFVNQNTDCMINNSMVYHSIPKIKDMIPLKSPLSKGQVACSLAHMHIYEKIVHRGLENNLILEDDSVFKNTFYLKDAITEQWDVLSLFSGFENGSSINESVNHHTKYTYAWDRQGTSAYALKDPSIAKYILDKQSTLMDTADGAFCDPNLKILALYPSVCTIDNSPSIIVNGDY